MSRALLFSAGDASGDEHAAELAKELLRRFPDLQLFGLGGDAMARAGVEIVVHQRELAVGGLFEVTRSLPRVRAAFRRLADAAVRVDARGGVLVDSGGFNLPFAAWLGRRRPLPLLYYVAPQAWAWRPGRARKLARRVERILVLFPFEVDFYRARGIPVEFVGHPLVDRLSPLAASTTRVQACEALSLDSARRWIALLPGSRRNELARHLPLQLEAARRLLSGPPGLCSQLGFAVSAAPSLDPSSFRPELDRLRTQWPPETPLELVPGRAAELMIASDVVLLKPGSSALEALMLDRPMVVMGRAHPLSAGLAKQALGMRYLAMPNLLAGEAIVPEFLQENADPTKIAAALGSLLDGPARARQLDAFHRLRPLLGSGGAVVRAAQSAGELFGLVEA